MPWDPGPLLTAVTKNHCGNLPAFTMPRTSFATACSRSKSSPSPAVPPPVPPLPPNGDPAAAARPCTARCSRARAVAGTPRPLSDSQAPTAQSAMSPAAGGSGGGGATLKGSGVQKRGADLGARRPGGSGSLHTAANYQPTNSQPTCKWRRQCSRQQRQAGTQRLQLPSTAGLQQRFKQLVQQWQLGSDGGLQLSQACTVM